MQKKCAVFLAVLLFAALLSSCGNAAESRLFMMDTVMDLKLWGDGAKECLRDMQTVLSELDRDLSAYRKESELVRVNSGEELSVGRYMLEVTSAALEYSERTDGAFSPLLGSLIELWGVGEKNYVPTSEEISAALFGTELSNVELSGEKIALKNGAKLNLGAITKGYASDIMRDMLIKHNVPRAVVSLGGNVYVHGTKEDNTPWNVALRDPKGGENDYFATVSLSDRFVISSGDYERYFERDGVRYHHIMDPKTGAPARSDLLAAIVVSENGALGDAYSTATYVMGRERALEFWRENTDFELVLVGRDGTVTVTECLSDCFTPVDGRYTYETASR